MAPPFDVRPVILVGSHVRLEPIGPEHAEDLFAAGSDPAIWRYKFRGPFASVANARAWTEDLRGRGDEVAFATVDLASGRCVGSTRYLDVLPAHRSVEIGATWLAPSHQRTALNTESKLLLLRHAFEDLGALRVTLKTDSRNEVSMRAIERLGAVREGVLRRHRVLPDGHVRDTVYYGIIAEDWPGVRARLGGLLDR